MDLIQNKFEKDAKWEDVIQQNIKRILLFRLENMTSPRQTESGKCKFAPRQALMDELNEDISNRDKIQDLLMSMIEEIFHKVLLDKFWFHSNITLMSWIKAKKNLLQAYPIITIYNQYMCLFCQAEHPNYDAATVDYDYSILTLCDEIEWATVTFI